MNPFYKDYNEYIGEVFPDMKVQKISVNAGFSCPNRDGTISRGGCIYCLNESFTPGYCMSGKERGVSAQLSAGKQFFARKYPHMKYLAYFQSFTNTFAPVGTLESLYSEAIDTEDVVGLVVGTRPDCLPDETISILGHIAEQKPVFVELGAESSHNDTLKRINRGHDWECVCDATRRLHTAGIHVGLHLIAGLPGERPAHVLETVSRAVSLPVKSLKLHHMQVLRGTPLARMAENGTADLWLFTLDEYLDLCCRIIELVPHHICIERFLASAPPHTVLSPKWGLKNHEFTAMLHNRLRAMEGH